MLQATQKKRGIKASQGIKSRARVRDRGEVFTELREINNILDLTADAHSHWRGYKGRILEPACGNGNFLVVILERRIKDIEKSEIRKKDQDATEFALLTALSSMYGVDIMPDNIVECHERLNKIIEQFYNGRVPAKQRRPEFFDAVNEVLRTNIQLGDMLNGKEQIEFVEYTSVRDGYFVRNVFRLIDLELGIRSSRQRVGSTHYLKIRKEDYGDRSA